MTPSTGTRTARGARLPLAIGACAAAVAALMILAFTNEQRIVAGPLLLQIVVLVVFLAVLWQRDGVIPYFDLGVVCVAVTFIYLAYPLFAFILADMQWSELSDNRLLAYRATAAQFAQVGWWGGIYLAMLATAYTAVRRYPAVDRQTRLVVPNRRSIAIMAWCYLFIFIFLQAVQIVFEVDLNPTYGADVRTVEHLPLFLRQITSKASQIGIVFQFALILLLVDYSNDPFWRWMLRLWAALHVLVVVLTFGARTSAVFFVLAWLLSHQRLRRPLRPLALAAIGLCVMAGVLLYGLVRDVGGRADTAGSLVFSASNEFQSLYGTSYDLLRLREMGMLSDIPWQIYVADLLRVIPQQLLPFDKIDPAEWYLGLIGLSGQGIGLMFGVTAEAALGFGMLEMALRGALVGLIFGLVHNWYARNASRFWATLFYLWLCIWSYYTYRASTFYLLSHVLLVFLPAYLAIRIFDDRRRGGAAATAGDRAADHRRL